MKIGSINTYIMRNDEHLGLMFAIRNTLSKYTAEEIDVPNRDIVKFNQMVENEDVSYKIVTKSAMTDELSKLDNVSDSLIVGFTTQTRSFEIHYDPQFQAAANRILIEYNAFGDIRNKTYVAQTTDTINFLQELNGKLKVDVDLLGLQGWVSRIADANNAFMKAFDARSDEKAAKDAFTRLRVCRTDTDGAFRAIVNRVNAGIVYNGEEQYESLVRDLNVTIDYYNNIMAQRRGRAAAKKEREAAEKNQAQNDVE
jgi:hypothetical protein